MKLYIFLFFLFSSVFLCNGQNDKELDSLMMLIVKNKHDSNTVMTLNEICWIYSYSQSDSSIKYGKIAQQLAEEINYLPGIAEAYKNIGNSYKNVGNYLDAETNYLKAIEIYKKVNQNSGISRCYNNLGLLQYFQGNFSSAIDFFQKAQQIAEKINDEKIISMCYNNLGMVNDDMKNNKIAIEYYEKSLIIKQKLNDKKGITNCLNNIANCFAREKRFEKAIDNYQTALKISKELYDIQAITMCLMNIGSIYLEKNEYSKAMDYFSQASKYLEKLGDKKRISENLNFIAQIHIAQNNYTLAKRCLLQSLIIAKEINAKAEIKESLHGLAKYYEKISDYKNAYLHYTLYKAYNDSVFSDLNSKQLHEIQTKFQTENQRQKIANQEIQISKQETEIKFQATIKYAFIVGFIAMFALAFLIFINYKNKKKANEILKSKNTEINQQKEEIQVQNENLGKANLEITNQKDIIEKSHQQITASISYAKRIQEAMLPKNDLISMLLPDHFILFLPRDVVSGDFYFIKPYKNQIFLAIADCSGHGVPGAFMSMLGMALLNELVRNPEIQNPAQLLNELREEIKRSLQQTGQKDEAQDGIDIAFCVFNLDTLIINYAGAYNPLWIFRNEINQSDKGSPTFIELQADHQPVGIFMKETPFSEQTFQLQTGDILYLFSDGYYSQFGGGKHETFKIKRFKELLTEINHLPTKEQKRSLEQNFINWKGNMNQTDDVLVFGVKI